MNEEKTALELDIDWLLSPPMNLAAYRDRLSRIASSLRTLVLAGGELADAAVGLRRLLWLRHGCDGLYGDDGEMQCGICLIDFKRDPWKEIDERFVLLGKNKLVAAEKGHWDPDGNFCGRTDCNHKKPEATT